MKKFLILLFVPLVIFCQNEIEEVDIKEEEEIISFVIVETAPIFPGSEPSKKSTASERKKEDTRCLNEGIMKHIKKNFEYPRIAKASGIQEKIYV